MPSWPSRKLQAFCYAIEEFVRIKSSRGPESCTDREQIRNRPRKRRLQPSEVRDIAFVKLEYGKEKTAKVPHHYDPRPQLLHHTSEEEIVELKRRLTDIGSIVGALGYNAVVHHTYNYTHTYTVYYSHVVQRVSGFQRQGRPHLRHTLSSLPCLCEEGSLYLCFLLA